MKYLLGCDFGGGASKATLLREDGQVIATASHEYPTYYPQNGWAEQAPEDSYIALCANIRTILRDTAVDPASIAALALDGATHTAVLLDEADHVLRPAIYWTDTRANAQAAWLAREHRAEIMFQSYNAPSALWTLPQLMWLAEHESALWLRVRRILSMKDYVRYRLTGDYVTDEIEAMGFMLLDARRMAWSPFLCGLAGLDPAIMPRIVPPGQVIGPLSDQACRDTGLSPLTQVIAGSTDTAMEVYAAGAIEPGQATVKLATAGRICAITREPKPDPLLVCYRHVVPGLWYPGTATKSCAASNRWFRDVLSGEEIAMAKAQGVDPYALMSAAAQTVPAGADGLFFHPYLQGEITPYLDDRLRASFTGLTAFHTKSHFNRAVLEGVGYSLKACFEVLEGMGIAPERASIIGGGAKSALWRQIICDMLGIPLNQVMDNDSSLGSAMLAGVSVGVFGSYADSVARCVKVGERVYPNKGNQAFYARQFEVYKRIHDALAPIYQEMEA